MLNRDLRIEQRIVADDGSDGIFFRGGQRWVRQQGVETPLLDLAPHLERAAIAQYQLLDSESLILKAITMSVRK